MKLETDLEELDAEVIRREFLGLTPEDEAVIALRLASHRKLTKKRQDNPEPLPIHPPSR